MFMPDEGHIVPSILGFSSELSWSRVVVGQQTLIPDIVSRGPLGGHGKSLLVVQTFMSG
jgi:hypothetical protein